MKKLMFLFLVVFTFSKAWAQEDRNFKIPLIGDTAPSFVAESTNGTIEFPSDFAGKWKILFSHPQDFTPVCSSELLELANMQKEFSDLNVKIIVLSNDKLETHVQWVKSLESLNYKNNVTQKIKFPLIDDDNLVVSKLYGMIHPSSNTTKDVRGVYIIDNNDVIQAIMFYPMMVGRNMEEIKRTVVALQTVKEGIAATPANWVPGEDIIIPYRRTEAESKDLYNIAWYMTFKKMK